MTQTVSPFFGFNLRDSGKCALHNKLEVTEMPVDPVCGMIVPDEHSSVCTTYKNKHYCFCSEECKEEFDTDPELYVGEEVVDFEEEFEEL